MHLFLPIMPLFLPSSHICPLPYFPSPLPSPSPPVPTAFPPYIRRRAAHSLPGCSTDADVAASESRILRHVCCVRAAADADADAETFALCACLYAHARERKRSCSHASAWRSALLLQG